MKLITALVFAFLTLLGSDSQATEKVLMVVTSCSTLGNTGEGTGFWLGELTHPYYVLTDQGFDVEIASIAGGQAPIDGRSVDQNDEQNDRFLNDAKAMRQVLTTKKLADAKPGDYAAVIFCGGHGSMWDFRNNQSVNKIAADIYESDGIVAAVCHGPAALIDVKLSNDQYLVDGKNVAAFTNEEETLRGLEKVVPFLLETELKDRGANLVSGKPWSENVVVDDRLVTGQNPKSAGKLGEEVARLLKK